MDLDYSTNVITPVNVELVTSRSLGGGIQNVGIITEGSSSFLDATVQDSYYTLLRQINPRYLGSKNTSKEYNTYTIGDSSFGQTAAIDLNSIKFAYFAEIVETGSAFPDRSNVYLKYLIDGRSNVTELTYYESSGAVETIAVAWAARASKTYAEKTEFKGVFVDY